MEDDDEDKLLEGMILIFLGFDMENMDDEEVDA